MERLQLIRCRCVQRYERLSRAVIIEQIPKFLEETVTPVDAVGVPRFALFHGPEEHFIQPQGVGTVLFDNHIGVNDIEHTLRHLLHGPAAFIDSAC